MFRVRIFFIQQMGKHFVIVWQFQLYNCVCIYNNVGGLGTTVADVDCQ